MRAWASRQWNNPWYGAVCWTLVAIWALWMGDRPIFAAFYAFLAGASVDRVMAKYWPDHSSAASPLDFSGFRHNRADYDGSREAWRAVFQTAIGNDHLAQWEEWLQDPFAEGSPIFSRVNYGTRRGVVINQILPEEDDLRFRAYVDEFATDTVDEIVYLSITCPLTEMAKKKAEKLIFEHGRHGAARDEMERFCAEATE